MEKNTYEIALQKDLPTHKLEIFKPNEYGKSILYKVLYFTEKQARDIAKSINNPGQFLVFGSVSYPKFGSFLEEMTGWEIKQRSKKYFDNLEQQRETNLKKESMEKSNTVDAWIQKNPEKWEKILKEKTDEITKIQKKNKKSFFWSITDAVKKSQFKAAARLEIYDLLFKK